MKILIAADGSTYTKRMLAYLAAHDEWLGASHQYTVVHVVAPVPGRAAAVIDRTALDTFYEEEAEKVLKPIRSFFDRQGIHAAYVVKVGQAAEAIAARAQAGRFDLLLMGSHGHGNLASLVMGSVAAKVMARCKTPLLLVR